MNIHVIITTGIKPNMPTQSKTLPILGAYVSIQSMDFHPNLNAAILRSLFECLTEWINVD